MQNTMTSELSIEYNSVEECDVCIAYILENGAIIASCYVVAKSGIEFPENTIQQISNHPKTVWI